MSVGRFYRLIADNADVIGFGIWVTIQLAIIAMLIAVVLGLIACLGSLSRVKILRFPSLLFVEFGRNTPILVQLIWVHFAWPEILGIKFTAWTSAVIALSLQSSGYLAEEFRAGIESIDKGQIEASQALGMTYQRLMRRIVVPQALMRMIPGILNQFVTCFKSTSIVSVIAVPDLMYQAGLIVSMTFLPMPVYSFVAFLYFIMVMMIAMGVRVATRHLPQFGYFSERHGGE
jgi:polar amino acid transport system permease protein